MKQRRQAIVAVLLAALVATALPVMAADPGLEVADRQETATDFDAGSHTNTTVWGSGTSAVVELPDFSDGFEDEPADSGVPEDWTVNNAPTSVNTTTQYALTGSQSMGVDGTNLGTVQPTDFPLNDPVTSNISASIYVESGSNAQLFVADGDARVLSIGLRSGDLQYRNTTGYHILDTAVDNGEWLNITLYDFDPATDTYSVRWETPDTSGTATGLEMESAMTEGWVDFQVYTDGAVAFYDDFSVEPPESGTFISDNFTASQVEQGWTNLTLSNASATVTWEYWDGSQWQTAATNTYSTSGNKTASVTGHASAQKWRVNVSYTNTAGSTTASLYDAGTLFNAATPTVNNSAASPSGGEQVTSNQVTLSIPVSDRDFGTAQGDQVDVEFYVDGSKVATKTITSNQTVQYTATISTGGSHTWHVVATDSYGESVTSSTFNFESPSTLYIRNVSDPDSLVNNSVTVEVTFFSKDGTSVITRTTTDGKINMTGLPVDKEFVVVARADKYFDRRVIIDDLFSQNSIYLLNTSKTAYDIVFRIDDSTGEFTGDEETELIIQRALNRSGTTKWRTVMGDQIGASHEAPATLEDGIRYRIIVRTNTSRRVLGHYIPVGPQDPEILPIGEVRIQGNITQGVAFGARIEKVSGTTVFRYAYTDPEKRTSNLRVRVYNESASGDPKIYDANTSGPLGTVIETVDFGSRRVDSRYKVVWNATLQDGSEINDVTYVGTIPTVGCFGLGGTVCELTGYLVIVLTFGLTIIKSPSLSGVATVIAAFAVDLLGMVAISSVQIGVAGGIALLLLVGRR